MSSFKGNCSPSCVWITRIPQDAQVSIHLGCSNSMSSIGELASLLGKKNWKMFGLVLFIPQNVLTKKKSLMFCWGEQKTYRWYHTSLTHVQIKISCCIRRPATRERRIGGSCLWCSSWGCTVSVCPWHSHSSCGCHHHHESVSQPVVWDQSLTGLIGPHVPRLFLCFLPWVCIQGAGLEGCDQTVRVGWQRCMCPSH